MLIIGTVVAVTPIIKSDVVRFKHYKQHQTELQKQQEQKGLNKTTKEKEEKERIFQYKLSKSVILPPPNKAYPKLVKDFKGQYHKAVVHYGAGIEYIGLDCIYVYISSSLQTPEGKEIGSYELGIERYIGKTVKVYNHPQQETLKYGDRLPKGRFYRLPDDVSYKYKFDGRRYVENGEECRYQCYEFISY